MFQVSFFILETFETIRITTSSKVTSILTIVKYNIFPQIYCLLCILSQYQEYKAGRGCDRHIQSDVELRVSWIKPLKKKLLINYHCDWNRPKVSVIYLRNQLKIKICQTIGTVINTTNVYQLNIMYWLIQFLVAAQQTDYHVNVHYNYI